MFRGLNEIKIATARHYYEEEGYTNEKIGKLLNLNESSIRAMVKHFEWERPDWYNPNIARSIAQKGSEYKGVIEKVECKAGKDDMKIFDGCWFKDQYIRDSRHVLPKVKVGEA